MPGSPRARPVSVLGCLPREVHGVPWYGRLRERWNCERPFRPMIRGDAYGSPDLLHEAPHQAKAVALAERRLHEADAIVADRKNGVRVVSRQPHVNRTCPSREGMKICVRYDLGDDDPK